MRRITLQVLTALALVVAIGHAAWHHHKTAQTVTTTVIEQPIPAAPLRVRNCIADHCTTVRERRPAR